MESTPSIAAQVIITVIPIVGIVCGSAVLFFYFYFSYRSKMLMIEKGVYEKPLSAIEIENFALLFGIISFCIGLVMSLFFLLKEGLSYGLLGGLIPLSAGAGLIAFFIIRVKMTETRDVK